MPYHAMIPVAALEPPEHPQREETLYAGIDELRDSIRSNGLQQPIGVIRTTGDAYRIIWGHRRSIAVTQLGWSLIGAMVYESGEANVDQLMGAENFHRNATSDREEALFYKRIMPSYPEGITGIAREFNVPASRIDRLLTVEQGDERVFALLGEGKLTLAQAVEINKFEAPGYKLQATMRASEEGASAETLRRWRQDIQRQGLDQSAAEVQVTWSTPQTPVGAVPEDLCHIGNHSVPLMMRKIYSICHDHYDLFLKGLESLGKWNTIEEAGLGVELRRLLRAAEGELQNGGRQRPEGEPS